MLDHANYNEALLAMLHAVEARIEARDRGDPEIVWEPDPDILRDLLRERELDREIERQAAEKKVCGRLRARSRRPSRPMRSRAGWSMPRWPTRRMAFRCFR